MAERKVPRIRFKGFEEDWEQRKLGEIASEILAGGDVNKKSIQEVGKYPVIANALTDGGIIGYYNEEYRISAPALTVTGRGDIGHAKVRLVNFTPVVRLLAIKAKHDMFFLENNINIRKPITESTGVPQLTIPQLANYELCIPKKRSEEESVGILFKYIDSLLSLHQRKLEKLKILKKAMLEKMFPKNGAKVPEIRFSGFTDDWEQRKFSALVIRESIIAESREGLPSVEYEDVIAEEGVLNKDLRTKTMKKQGVVFFDTDVLYGKLRPYLHNWLMPKFDGVAVGDWWVLRPIEVDRAFLYRSIQTQKFDEIANQSSGSKMPRADWKLISETEFEIPVSLEEQKAVGNYFERVDSLISLHQRKLEKLRQIKKSMLERMFV